MSLSAESCYRAICAKDTRFDGLFFVGVKTTGVYCRPICPARTPKQERCEFFTLPAEAERAGYRACFRCRPELAPGGAPIDRVPALVRRAITRIDSGCLNEGTVDDLAEELGVTGRQLRRAMDSELGLSPIEMAQSRRLGLAKQLLQDTSLPVVEVAFASGFSSVRRFNALVREHFGKSPSAIRQRATAAPADFVELRLDFRPPLEFKTMLAFLAERCLPGVERVEDGEYRRSVRVKDTTGWFAVREDRTRPRLIARVSTSLTPKLWTVVTKVRRIFDLDAQPKLIAKELGRDRRLAALIRRHPGLRPPGAFDGFEISTRAILGQQVSVRAATTLATRLVERFGSEVEGPPGIDRAFPTARDLARCQSRDIARIGVPLSRARGIRELARAVDSGRISFDSEDGAARLVDVPGIGEWTAAYVAMRAFGAPDAFPAGDVALWRALGVRSKTAALARAERWRPFRAYAVIQLWTSLQKGERT